MTIQSERRHSRFPPAGRDEWFPAAVGAVLTYLLILVGMFALLALVSALR